MRSLAFILVQSALVTAVLCTNAAAQIEVIPSVTANLRLDSNDFVPVPAGDEAIAVAPEDTNDGEVITVTGIARGAPRPLDRGASTVEITPSQLSKTAQTSAGKILEQAPGLFLANEGGSGHADQVFLRGFDAEQGQDIEFSVGGVPINEVDNTDGHGYSDTHFIIPELVRSLRVIEGPFDPHQGDFAVAGSANYELGVVNRGMQFEQSLGSFSTQRSLALWAPEGEREGTFGAAQVTN